MNGTSATTGKSLSGIEHLRQSVRDILTTPIGSRVMRRDYGSRLYELVDAPLNRSTIIDIIAATAEAIARWEPRFRVTRVVPSSVAAGSVSVDVTGIYLPDGKEVTLDGVKVS